MFHTLHLHVFVLALQATQGEAWAMAFKRWDVYVDPCCKLYPEEVRQIKMETVNAPTMQVRTKICRNTVQKKQLSLLITAGASSNVERRVYEPP